MDSKKNQVWLPVLMAVVLIIGMAIGYGLKERTGGRSFWGTGKKSSVQEVMDLIQSKYVDPVKVDSLNEITIKELLSHLDPHSIYIPENHVKILNEDLEGHFTGIGVEFQIFNDTLNIINVIKDGPSEKAGVQIGDKLIAINDTIKITGKKDVDDFRKHLRGQDGSKVTITVKRDKEIKKIEIVRGDIKVSSIDAAYIIEPTIGYIRINKFGQRTYVEFMQNLEMLQKKGMSKLVLDLRGNGGGLMDEAVKIADEFIEGNKMIVYTKGENSEMREEKAKRDGLFEKGKLVVLVDETSASASEVLSGALQDWDRATIVGRRTFGKGLVQQQFQLGDGGALRLTVSRYYTPLGRNIQKAYSNKSKKEYENEVEERYKDGEVLSADSIKQKGQSFKTPKGHVVYGGGGIVPDVFVAADTFANAKALYHIYNSNILNRYVFLYFIANKEKLKKITSVDLFTKTPTLTYNELNNFLVFAQKEGKDLKDLNEKNKLDILRQMNGILAKQLFQNNGYFEFLNKDDKFLEQSLQSLKN